MFVFLPSFSHGYASTLVGTSWRLKLDVGLEPGSWMPRKIEGWGASGARVLVDALVDFDATPASEGEELVGPMDQTRVISVRGGGTIVTLQGEQEVSFESGGWCVQRPLFANPAEEEGLLRFWLDCPSGCAKNDVSVPPGERIFFSTGVWDDANGLQKLRAKATAAAEEQSTLESMERAGDDASSMVAEDLLCKLPLLGPVRRQFLRMEASSSLRRRRAYYASWPGLDDQNDQRAALIASSGSLSLKQERPRGYIYLGKFGAEPLIRPTRPKTTSGGRRSGNPAMMGFADWGKGSKVASASHILCKERQTALQLLDRIERGEISFEDAAAEFSSCGSAAKGGSLGSFRPGEMVAEFDSYCFDPASELGAVGVVDTEFGTHLIRLEKQNLGVAEGKSQKVKARRMADTPDPETGLRT